MATTQLNAVSYGYVDQANPNTHYSVTPSSWYRIGADEQANADKQFLFQFSSFPSSLKRKNLVGAQLKLHLRGVATSYSFDSLFWDVFSTSFNPNTVTWNNKPSVSAGGDGKTFFGAVSEADYTIPESVNTNGYKPAIALASGGGVQVRFSGAKTNEHRDTMELRALLSNNAAPYITITYDNTDVTSKIEYRSGPQSGYYDPRNNATFSWAYVKANSALHALDEVFTQASATFYWKKSTDSDYTAVQISGSAQNVTIAANTFPTASTIQWYVIGTDTDGTTTQTPVYSFSTAAGTAYAYAQAPIGSVEDGSAPITFRWTLGSSDGQTPSRVRVWWKLPSEDNNSWHVLCDESQAITSYTAAAGTFPAGEIQWKVQAFNIDGTAGPWDANIPNAKTFVSVAAPAPVQGLSATAVPRTTISWQSGEQKAYEISIDGTVVRRAFSETVNSWRIQEPLPDGDHVISVRVQGQYGLWSQPSTITITIQNSPPWSATLFAEFDLDAMLSVDIGSQTMTPHAVVYWYRDGVRIAQVTYQATSGQFGYTDRAALGEHSYYAELWHTNGNYTRTNVVTGTMNTRKLMIAPAEGGDWLDLGLSEQSENQVAFNMSSAPALYHVVGAKYPQADLSPFADLSGTYNCAFSDLSQAAQFEALFGSAVILKSRWGNVVTGILTPIQKKAKRFYVAYTFTVQQMHTNKLVVIDENS